MDSQFLSAPSQTPSNNDLILFFHGWSGSLAMVNHLDTKKSDKHHFDILVFSNYQHLSLSNKLIKTIEQYQRVHLVAWSFGVWVANYICHQNAIGLSSSVAYNGSLFPIDNQLGIPKRVAQATLKYLSEDNLALFLSQMTLGLNPRISKSFYQPEHLSRHKQSLAFLYECFAKQQIQKNVFNHAVIGDNDVIIPVKSQINAWQKLGTPYQVIDSPHYPFAQALNWESLLFDGD